MKGAHYMNTIYVFATGVKDTYLSRSAPVDRY